jgi:hypothetical protein
VETSEREPMGKTLRERLLSLVRRQQSRILGRRVLKEPTPLLKTYVIVFAIAGSKPIKYFRYDYEEVWVWSKTPSRATKFRSYDSADNAAQNCSVYYKSSYEIIQLT